MRGTRGIVEIKKISCHAHFQGLLILNPCNIRQRRSGVNFGDPGKRVSFNENAEMVTK